MPHERALGIKWNTNKDTFYFKVKPVSKPNTRRGIISIISSIYDPLGFISPVVIVGKMLFQELTKRKLGWDDPVPDALEVKWKTWCEELPLLEEMQIPRCVKPITCHVPVQTQLHHFSDASQAAYGVVTFLRVVDSLGHIHVALLMSKARLAPIKAMTIPRLELTAAVLASKLDTSLKTSVKMKIDSSYFWCDSQLVIQYIRNEKKRFHVFAANRIATIQQASTPINGDTYLAMKIQRII